MTRAAHPGGVGRVVTTTAGTGAIVSECRRGPRYGNGSPIRKARHAAIRIAGEAGFHARFGRGTIVSVGSEPFPDGNRIAAELHGCEPAVGAAHGDDVACARNQNVGPFCHQRGGDREARERPAREPQRASQQAEQEQPRGREQHRADPEG